MGFNVSASTGYMLENKSMLRNTAKNILNKQTSPETTQKIVEKTFFSTDAQIKEMYVNPQLSIIKASSQISLNNSLKETLKYLKNHSSKRIRNKHVLGEIWEEFSSNNYTEENLYKGELYDFEIDKNARNIFAA